MADTISTVAWARKGDVLTDIEDTIEELVGWTSEEVFSKRTVLPSIISPQLARNARLIEDAMARPGDIHSIIYETEIIHKNGTRTAVESHIVILKNGDDPFIVGVVRPRCEIRALWDRLGDESRRMLWRIGQRLAEIDEALSL